jgi:hypothetical protein
MRQSAYDQIVKGSVPALWDSPYYWLFVSAVVVAINIERLDGKKDLSGGFCL